MHQLLVSVGPKPFSSLHPMVDPTVKARFTGYSGGSYETPVFHMVAKGKGPVCTIFRHAFAVHRLEMWYRQGTDLRTKLPLLATYMGHKNLVGTQRYLRLTPEIFPDIIARLEKFVGHVIPRTVDK
jgi:integrase